MSITLFKLGGSLLEMPDLAARLEGVLRQRAPTVPLIVVGGGAAADLVRRWDEIHDLTSDQSHWLAVTSLKLNDALVRELLPQCESVATMEELAKVRNSGRLPLLDTEAFLRADEASGDALPHNWNVTSDSIAARAAICFQADELVLIKSVPLPEMADVAAAEGSGLVDPHFRQLASQISNVSWCDLRAGGDPLIVPWLKTGRLIAETETSTSRRR